jgi:UDP-N-acetylmuramoyl-tripeptide--D-alanyl-D-alanine ligase
VAVANADEPRIMARLPRAPKVITFGAAEGASVRLLGFSLHERGTRAEYRAGDATLAVELGLFGEAAAVNGAAALAVAVALGRPLDAFARGLEGVRPTPGRFAPREGREGSLVLDDTYNANPRAMVMALRTAGALRDRRGGRLVVVLGDMRELGAITESAHREVGRVVAEIHADLFVATGASMAHAAEEATRLGVRVQRAADAAEAARIAVGALAPGDLVLAKGSRSMGMEAVVEALVPAPEVRP